VINLTKLNCFGFCYQFLSQKKIILLIKEKTNYTECPKNGVLTVHYGVEEIIVNVQKNVKQILLYLFADLAVFESGT
jgi:hypothetical protein